MKKKEVRIIGRRESVRLPGIFSGYIPCKVDTGAYTSSLHCESILKEGQEIICTFQYKEEKKTCKFVPLRITVVKSSNGIQEERYIIKTKIILGKENYDIELSLTDRSSMKYPILIGRKFLHNKFLVDVSRKKILST